MPTLHEKAAEAERYAKWTKETDAKVKAELKHYPAKKGLSHRNVDYKLGGNGMRVHKPSAGCMEELRRYMTEVCKEGEKAVFIIYADKPDHYEIHREPLWEVSA